MSDQDEPAKRLQKKFQKEKLHGTWKRYDEILPGAREITAEDFIKKEVFIKACNEIRKDNSDLTELTLPDLDDSRGIMYVLKNWVKFPSIDNEKQKEIVDAIKEKVFSELKPLDIEDNYYNLLEKLAENMNLSVI